MAEKPTENAAAPVNTSSRPTGVTIIAILVLLGALLTLFSGIMSFAIAGTAESLGAAFGAIGLGGVIMVWGAVYVVLGLAGLAAFYMLLRMKKMGMALAILIGLITIAMILMNASALTAEYVMSTVTGIAIQAVVILYLLKKRQLFV